MQVATLKHSRQRESIREFVISSKEHPTAGTVYAKMKEIYPNISLGTVYRNLALLVDLGEISKIATGTGPDRFDCHVSQHSHFICSKCYNIYDIDSDDFEEIRKKAEKNLDGVITEQMTNFYGICGKCLKNNS